MYERLDESRVGAVIVVRPRLQEVLSIILGDVIDATFVVCELPIGKDNVKLSVYKCDVDDSDKDPQEVGRQEVKELRLRVGYGSN